MSVTLLSPRESPKLITLMRLTRRMHPSYSAWDDTIYQPLEVYDLIGPSAWNCIARKFTKSNPSNASDVTVLADFGLSSLPQTLLLSPQLLVQMLRGMDGAQVHLRDKFDEIFVASPSAPLTQPSQFLQFEFAAPTPLLRRAFVTLLRGQSREDLLEIAKVFYHEPIMLGIWFEAYAINSVLSGGVGVGMRVGGGSLFFVDTALLLPDLLSPLPLLLTDLYTPIPTPSKTALYTQSTELEIGVLYSPNSRAFPTLDAFLLTSDHKVVLFKANFTSNHPYKGDGLDQVVTSLRRRSTPMMEVWEFFLVFLVPGEDAGEKLATSFAASGMVSVRTSISPAQGGGEGGDLIMAAPLQVGFAVIHPGLKLPTLLVSLSRSCSIQSSCLNLMRFLDFFFLVTGNV